MFNRKKFNEKTFNAPSIVFKYSSCSISICINLKNENIRLLQNGNRIHVGTNISQVNYRGIRKTQLCRAYIIQRNLPCITSYNSTALMPHVVVDVKATTIPGNPKACIRIIPDITTFSGVGMVEKVGVMLPFCTTGSAGIKTQGNTYVGLQANQKSFGKRRINVISEETFNFNVVNKYTRQVSSKGNTCVYINMATLPGLCTNSTADICFELCKDNKPYVRNSGIQTNKFFIEARSKDSVRFAPKEVIKITPTLSTDTLVKMCGHTNQQMCIFVTPKEFPHTWQDVEHDNALWYVVTPINVEWGYKR